MVFLNLSFLFNSELKIGRTIKSIENYIGRPLVFSICTCGIFKMHPKQVLLILIINLIFSFYHFSYLYRLLRSKIFYKIFNCMNLLRLVLTSIDMRYGGNYGSPVGVFVLGEVAEEVLGVRGSRLRHGSIDRGVDRSTDA